MAIDVAKRCWYPVLALVLNLSFLHAGERWSRQLTEFANVPGNDWVPLGQACPTCRHGDRQAGAKVLNYFNSGPSYLDGADNNAQPQHHQFSFVNQQFPSQSSRLVFSPQGAAQPLQQDFDPGFNQPFGNHQSFLQSPFGALQSIQRHPAPQFNSQPTKDELIHEKPLALEQQQQQQQQSYTFPSLPQPQADKFAHSAVPSSQNHLPLQAQPNAGVSQEEVQLLYVPVETLYNQKPTQNINRFNALPQPVSASLINDFYTAATTTQKPRTTSTPYTTKATTKASLAAKLKPNQPPLAMFMYNDDRQSKLTTTDALVNLKNLNQINVLDSLSKNLPKIFIGPSGLAPPKGYSKFDLPYLSNVEHKGADGKFDELPFFVAPLSYKTPNGFTKIPLPSPHVGSVIVQQTAAPSHSSNYYRQPDNIEYYQPATLKFTEGTTKSPITLPASKPQYETDHYSSPTFKPTTDRINYSRGSTQPPQESYRQPQTERALFSQAAFNSINNLPNRHVVNEEYFNLAKTRKPTTPSPTPNYSIKTYKPFEFKPIPEQKIPVFPDEADQTAVYTTPRSTTTTTEKTHSSRLEDTRVKSYYKEENFRNRRPYSPSTVQPQYTEEEEGEPAEIAAPVRHSQDEDRFVHNFKLVDSVRPQTTQPPKSVIENAFLDFIQQDNHEPPKTPAVANNSPRGQQIIRNNYFATNDDQPKQKYVSTYYVPTVDTTTARTTPPTTVVTTTTTTAAPETDAPEDPFFKSFEEKSKLYEKEPPRFVQSSRTAQPSYTVDLRNQEPFLNQYTEPSYTNKYKYETNTDGETHYPVEVVTTQEPARYETTSEANSPASDQSYSIPSELPPISANLPGLINSLMEDEWPNKKDEQITTTTKGYFRKQTPRTSTQATPTAESYETTTRRTRGRRPTGTTSTTESVTPTRATTINRNRSRYVSANDDRSVSRGRTRSRVQTTPRNPKQEENLDYQRDVLKQNYPIIRPVPLTTTNQPPTTNVASTTFATTIPVTYQQIYEEQTERLYPFLAPESDPLPEEPKVGELPIPKREPSFTEQQVYQPEVTSVLPPSTHQEEQQYFPAEQDDDSVRVLPVSHAVEPQREISYIKPVEVQREQPVYVQRRRPVKQEEPLTTPAYRQEEEQELRKVEITPRPRRPLNRQPVYSPRTTTTTERVITERITAEPTRGPQRRPAFARRPARPLYTTTPQPTTTYSSRAVTSDDEQPTQGSFTVRPKNRQDILRGRTRRPVTTTTTTAPTDAPEPTVARGITRNKELRRVSPTFRSRQEQQQTQQAVESTLSPRFRIRERSRFSLQPQETQWSTKLSQNSFQPVAESRSRSFDEKLSSIEPEPEIVTASALVQQEDDVQLINVSANLAGPTAPAGVITKEVALRQEPPQADESLEKGFAPSFAELLNDVVKDFIDDGIQKNETEVKAAENNELPVKEKPVTEPQRDAVTQGRKNAINRNNFRKRGRSRYVVDSLETAESQHIKTHFFNSATFAPLKSIDTVNAPGKNIDNDPKGSSVVEEESVQQMTTASPTQNEDEDVTSQPETTTVAMVETTPVIETTSVLPTERENTTPLPTLEVQQYNDEPMSTEQVFYDGPDYQAEEAAAEDDHRHGIFADVKKQISDLFAMADNDPQTEEIEDEDHYRPMMMGYHAFERTSTLEPEAEGVVSTTTVSTTSVPTTTTALAPTTTTAVTTTTTGVSVTTTSAPSEETQPDPVTVSALQAMDAMAIPTSTSNGIMHETEICYRGRCVKTDKKKQKKNRFKPN